MSEHSSVTIIDRAWPVQGFVPHAIRIAAIALLGSLLLTLSAKVQVPFYPVPMTMQTAVVFLLGLTLGPELALATVGFYLFQGAIGLPVLAGTPEKGIGIAYMVGPTGGYLLGFLFAAFVCGWGARKGFRGTALALCLFMATAAVYLPGLTWLSAFIGIEKAWTLGAAPFLLGDVTKIALVVVLMATGIQGTGRTGSD